MVSIKAFGKQLKSDLAGGLNLLSAAFIKPKKTFSGLVGLTKKSTRLKSAKSLQATTKSLSSMTLGTKVKKTAISTAVAGAAVVAGGVAGKSIAASPAAKKFIIKTATGKKVVKAVSFAAALALLAPKTTKKVISSKATRSTVIAAAVNPVAGVVVGLEQGTSLLGTAVKSNLPTIKKAGAIAGGAALTGAAAVGAGVLIKKKLDSKKESVLTPKDLIKTAPAVPLATKEPVGAVKEPVKAAPVTPQKAQRITQKVQVNQKVYKVASVDMKYGRTRNKKRRRRK